MGRKQESEKEAIAVRQTSAPGPVSGPGEALLKALQLLQPSPTATQSSLPWAGAVHLGWSAAMSRTQIISFDVQDPELPPAWHGSS